MLRALACCCTAATTALSISLSVPALRTIISSPRRRTAASDCSMLSRARPGLFGFTRTAIRVAPGRSSRSNSSRLGTSSVPIRVTPVTLPSGRPRLGTKPAPTGSEAVTNTIGIVFVAASAARTATSGAPALMTATLRLTRSAAIAGSRSNWPSAQRYSMVTLRPSAKPVSPRPRWNPAMRSVHCAADTPCSTPITGIAGCCARAASGHAAAAPPRAASNSRRPMVTVIRPSRARCVNGTIPRHKRAVLTARHSARGSRRHRLQRSRGVPMPMMPTDFEKLCRRNREVGQGGEVCRPQARLIRLHRGRPLDHVIEWLLHACARKGSILVEHLLDLIRFTRLRQRQLQQDARLLRAQVVGGNESRLLPIVVAHHPAGADAAAADHHDTGGVVQLLERVLAG